MSLFTSPFDPAREAALVTGAGNGIGRAIAQALVGEGVRTVFADLHEDKVLAAIKAAPRPELAVPWVGDLARAARPIMRWRSMNRPGGRCTRSTSMPAFICRANWRAT